ncbi:hypothetical protein CDIK_4491, partial [Cucumispora dikerogammari]
EPQVVIQPTIVYSKYKQKSFLPNSFLNTSDCTSIKAVFMLKNSCGVEKFKKRKESTLNGNIKILMVDTIDDKDKKTVFTEDSMFEEATCNDYIELIKTFSQIDNLDLYILSLDIKNKNTKEHPLLKYFKTKPTKAFKIRVVLSESYPWDLDENISSFITDFENLIQPLNEMLINNIAIIDERVNKNRMKHDKKAKKRKNTEVFEEIEMTKQLIEKLKNIPDKLKAEINYYLNSVKLAAELIRKPDASHSEIINRFEEKEERYFSIYKYTKDFIKKKAETYLNILIKSKTSRKKLFN